MIAIMASVVVPKKLPICREKALGSGVRPLWGQMGSSAYPFGHQDQELCLLCAFDGPPRIVLHGRGDVVQIGDRGFAELEALFDFDQQPAATQAARAVVVVEVERVADSCGYGVPLMRYEGERPQQLAWIESKLRQLSHKSRSARSPGECL